MVIGFWSEAAGVGGTTSNMIITGLTAATEKNKKITLMQGKYDRMRFDYAFSANQDGNLLKEDYGYYNHPGMDDLIEKHLNDEYQRQDFYDNLVNVNHTSLCYVPTGARFSEDLFKKKMQLVGKSMIQELKDIEGDVFVELECGYQDNTKSILDLCDVIVINMNQAVIRTPGFLQEEHILNKCILLIGRFDSQSRFNLKTIARRTGIPENRIGIIPYNIRFQDSMYEGRVLDFMEHRYHMDRHNAEYMFFKEVFFATELILRRAEKCE